MNPTPANSTKHTKTSDTPTPDASKPVEKSTDPKSPEAPTPTAGPKDGKSSKKEDARRVISVSVPEKLARQLRLLCATTGQTTQSIVEGALRKAVNRQLGAALEAIKSDLET